MTPPARDVAAIIRKLTALAKEEARALANKNFKSISECVSAKLFLAGRLDAAIVDQRDAPGRDLERELGLLRALSVENAAHLAALRNSVVRARARIESLTAAETLSGVYGAQGAILRTRAAGGRNA